jgi:hypothetical protein
MPTGCVVFEADALAGELVDPKGRDAAPVTRKVAPAGIIVQNENDVWPRLFIHGMLPLITLGAFTLPDQTILPV